MEDNARVHLLSIGHPVRPMLLRYVPDPCSLMWDRHGSMFAMRLSRDSQLSRAILIINKNRIRLVHFVKKH